MWFARLTSRRNLLTLVAVLVATVPLWYFSAYPRGQVDALFDCMRGHYEVQSYGYPAPTHWDYCRLLKARYGVVNHMVAGCCVDPCTGWYADGYNSVSIPFLKRRFGRDIFAECYQLSQQPRDAADEDE